MEVGLSESNFILLTIGQMTVGVVYDTLTDTYWVFDSHARDAYGEPSAFGKAVLITFSTLHELLTYLHTNYSNLIYNLTPVNILQRLEQFQREHELRNQSRSDERPKSGMTSDSTLKLDNYIGGNIAQAGNFDVAEPSIPPSSNYMHHSYPMGQCIAATPFSGFTEVSDSCATHTLSNAVTDTNLQNSELMLNHTYIKSSLSFDNRRHNLHSNYYHSQSTSDNGESFPDQNLDSSMLTQNTFACLDSHEVASHNEEPVIHTNRLINDSLCLQSVCPLPNYFHFSNQSCSNVIAPTSVIPPHCLQQDQSPNDFSLCECEALINRMELISNASKSKNVSPCFITGICQYPSQRCTCCECFIWPKNVKQCSFLNDKCLLLNLEQGAILCTKCHSLLQKAQVPKVCTSYNKLKTGYVPQELSNMFVIEKRIIAQIPVFLTLIILPGGQSAQKGTAINIPIDITEQISLLTQTHQPGMILISCERPNDNPVVLPLRQSVLYRAFSWLKSNNHLYKDINITHLLPLSAGILYDDDDDTVQEEYGLIGKDSMSYQGNYNNVDTPACTLPVACGQPVTLSSIPFGEEKAFPWLFPNGINGISTNRPLPLTTLDYYQSRLYNHDSRWRCDIPYIMSALNNHEWELLTSLVSTYMRTKKLCAGTGSFLPVTAADVNNARNDPILMQNTYMFTKDIRGTAAYWKSVLMKLLAMVRSLGPPTFFLTLSANDNWPETKAMLKLHKQHFYNNIDTVQGDPLMASLAFQQRWSVLLKEILKKEAPLGKINEFFIRVEFQARGAPHLHIFLWTETGISLETATSNEIIALLDKTICTQLPDENKDKDLHRLVHTLQVHKHSFTCRKGVCLCRFNFPKPVCKQTKLCYNPDTILHCHGKFYETQRFFTDTWVNAYNPIILRHWRANMDIQLVGNAESCAFYVCKYICKAEPEELKEGLHALFTNTEFTTIDMRKRLLKIGACVLKKRRISAQEAVYRLGSMKLYQSSKQVITLNTLPPHRRMKLIKPKAQRDHLPLNCTDENLIFESNILDYYRKRPSNLSAICLHDFASWYARDSGPQRPSAKLPRYKLQSPYNNIVFRRRQHNVIIKPSHVKQTTDDFYYSCLLLYLPHTTENQLLIPFPSYKASFYNHFQDLDPSYKRCVVIASELEAAVRRIRLSQLQLNMSYTEQNPENVALATDANDYAVYDIPNSGNPNTSVMMNCDIPSNASDDFCWHTLSTCSLSETELETNIAKLTADQKNVMQVVQSHFSNPDTQTRLRIFCTGGAGAGKSFLLKTIVEWIRLCYPFQPGHDPVIVTAPSGVAARNVLGLTIHSVFRLPVQHGYEPEYHDLSSFALKKLQDVFRNVHTIIVDEISMVSCKYFHYIHQRLCSIKNCGEPFGGLNVILFGDFYQLRPVRGHFFFHRPNTVAIIYTFLLNKQ